MNIWGLLADEDESIICTRFLTICRYHQSIDVNKAKKLFFPAIRGTWLLSFDHQGGYGFAVNWLGIRVRISDRGKGYPAKQARRPMY